MTQYDLEKQWIQPEGIPHVNLRFGDTVRISSGEAANETGEVIALISLEPEPVYVVELPAGNSIVAPQSNLVQLGTNSGRRLIMHQVK